LKKVELNGKVFSGQGEGRTFLELPWVKQQIKNKLGFTPYPGTLNLRLSEENAKRRKMLEEAPVLKVRPSEGYCTGLIYKAAIGNVECGVVIPEIKGYPHNVLEVVAPTNLKRKLELKDGDDITVTVKL
jgi:riboflavin kinase